MIFTAMAIGAGIGALAGLAVYGAKVAFSKETRWSWRDAAAHAAGGLVGGGVFPPVMAGLAALGLPTAAAYVVAGGVAWGGIWSLAQDAASWGLGRAEGIGPPRHYLLATAIGLAASALLLPLATRAVGPAGELARHSGSVKAFLSPHGLGNVVKSEAEFLAYGAISETTVLAGEVLARHLPVLVTQAAREAKPEKKTRAAARNSAAAGAVAPLQLDAPHHTGGLAPASSAPEHMATIPLFGRLGQRLGPAPALEGDGLIDALQGLEHQD